LPERKDASAGRGPKKGKWQKETSFFGKKEAKNRFPYGTRLLLGPALNGQSFFASFCSQKEDACLPSCPLPSLTYG
jgi:hypothetical protein